MTRPIISFWTILIILFGTVACKDNKAAQRENRITRIVFATGGCYGPCPIQVFDIDSSLSVKYNGIENTELKGFHRGRITREFWDSLNTEMEKINYKQLDSAYIEINDGLTTELMIYDNDKKIKYIHAQSASLPDSVEQVYNWLLGQLDKVNLTKTQESLTFPTYKNRPPFRTIIKFLPPKVDSEK